MFTLKFFIVCLFISGAYASDDAAYAQFCDHSCDTLNCRHLDTPDISSEVIPQEIQQLSLLSSGAEALLNKIQSQVDQWGDFTRWLKGTPLKGRADGLDERWQKLQDEARALLEVHDAIKINKARLRVCHRGQCSPGRRIELEEEAKKLEQIRAMTAALSPWWISEEFIELANRKNSKDISSEDLRSVLIGSMTNFFKQSFELRGQLSIIKNEVDASFKSPQEDIPFDRIIPHLAIRNGLGLEAILRQGFLNQTSENLSLLCQIADKKESIEKLKTYASNTVTVGLLASSLLLGPESLLMSGALRGVATRGTLGELRALMTAAPRATNYMADMALTGQVLEYRIEVGQQCLQAQASLQLGSTQESDWQQCLRERKNADLRVLLAGLSNIGTFALPMVRGLVRPKISKAPSSPPIVMRTIPEKGIMSTLDLSRKNEVTSQELSSLSDHYWNFVGDVYRKRLNLSEKEISDFVNSSRAMESRTKLVVMTRGPPGASKIEGGVAMVESKQADDLLPLEKATSIHLPRDEGKIAEIVRLTSVSESNPNLMKDLLQEMAQLTKANPDIKKIYVYTSKVHARLYKRLGIPFRQVGKPIERDVILEMNPKEFSDVLLAPTH